MVSKMLTFLLFMLILIHMSLESTLIKFGLSEKAIKVYLACLQLGTATMTEIARIAKLKRPTTYLVVDDLILKGFLVSIKKGPKKYYYPEPPIRLMQLLHYRVKEMEETLPELEAIYNEQKAKPKIKVYEGKEAVNNIYDEMYTYLGKKEEALFFTAIGDLQLHFPEALNNFFRQLKQKRDYHIRELNVRDEQALQYLKKIKPIQGPNHHIRLLSPSLRFSNTDNLIFGNKLIIFSIKENVFAIVIEDHNIANAFRSLFNAAWEMSKEI